MFPSFLYYGTVDVYSPFERETNPIKQFKDAHYEQGFCWSDDSASFVTLAKNKWSLIQIVITDSPKFRSTAIRRILVPFTVKENSMGFSNALDFKRLYVPSGQYELLFETSQLPVIGIECCRFILKPTRVPAQHSILLADQVITRRSDFLLSADEVPKITVTDTSQKPNH